MVQQPDTDQQPSLSAEDETDDPEGASDHTMTETPAPDPEPVAVPVSKGQVLRAVAGRILFALGASLALAAVVHGMLEASLRMESDEPTLLGPALLSFGVLWVVVLGVVGLVGSLRAATVVVLTLGLVLAAVNVVRMDILLIPLSFRDVVFLKDPAFLAEMVPMADLVKGSVAVVVVAGLLTLLVSRAGRRRPRWRRGRPGWLGWLAFRGVAVALAVTLVLLAAGFNQPGNVVRGAYDRSGADWRPWSQSRNYLLNGFVGGVLSNLPTDPMATPPGYSRATMEKVAERWAEVAEQRNKGTDPDVLARTNVVVVLSESMGDPAALQHATFAEDPSPEIHALMRAGGAQMISNFYGTGTSSMEFAVLTGQNTTLFKPQISSPYQQFVTDYPHYPNAVGWLKQMGHRAVAIHPYSPHMYQRTDVYKNFGFDEFIDRDSMTERARLGKGGFISDRSAYREVLRELRESDDPMVVQLVSMQNHLPYQGRYDDPIGVSSDKPIRAQVVGQWARGVKGTDEAVAEFLRELTTKGERTIVIQYGDHFPGIFSDAQVRAEGLDMYRTPFFVWDSAHPDGVAGKDAGLVGNPGGGAVAPNAAMQLALQQVGASMPPYFTLLAEVQEKVGVVRGRTVLTPQGEQVPIKELDEEQRALVRDMKLVQYDFSIGERYVLDEMWYPAGK
ncbi:LTA synthase family protein [Nocardioides daphniae]|uniref:LTA synthase family protein n=1 Tax=Nocardioides daphniae TaxID=402297 RepID=A0A4V1CWE3_9ACTN|nr:LTA synthase family protein [Nocardioides daphniae]QCC76967.1 LTA synthase family protein [Nocardioides daphniae]GGD18234.1 membrane protein [Nocardioides daphniae]